MAENEFEPLDENKQIIQIWNLFSIQMNESTEVFT